MSASTINPSFLATVFPSLRPTNSLEGGCLDGKTICTSASKNLTLNGLIYTSIISIILLALLLILFEYARHYKQIFLKRYQKRFINIGRVPSQPPDYYFGWLVAIFNVSESDVLHMVGLDAYMCLRYHVLCIKLGVCFTLCGLVVLLPVYCTIPNALSQWDMYTVLNIAAGPSNYKSRYWVTCIFAYIFAIYFCQLFYKEYDKFSTLRLSYLTKSDEVKDVDEIDDPDVMPQKDYSVMLEYIPANLRSEEKLYEYFDELFPGEIFTVEVALDLRDLETLIAKRIKVRNQLEQAIAYYIATKKRKRVQDSDVPHDILLLDIDHNDINYKLKQSNRNTAFKRDMEDYEAQFNVPNSRTEHSSSSSKIYHDRNDAELNSPSDSTFKTTLKYIRKQISYCMKVFHYELSCADYVDAIDYTTERLQELNRSTKELQDKLMLVSKQADKEIQNKIKMKHDTRAALILSAFSSQIDSTLKNENLNQLSTLLENFSGLLDDDEEENQRQQQHSFNSNTTAKGDTTLIRSISRNSHLSDNLEHKEHSSKSNANNSSASDQSLPPLPKITPQIKSRKGGIANSRFGKEAIEQIRITTSGAFKGVIELERSLEMVLLGAYYKYSSTAFITFKSRIAELVAHSMVLDHDRMKIQHAPSTNDIIWGNVAIPKSQINYRNFVTNILLVIGSIFWSSLVTALNDFAGNLNIPKDQESFFSVMILLGFLLVLPFIFDFIARYYEGMKLESEIQNSIMTRYFYYQVVNIYVTVCLTNVPIHGLLFAFLRSPQLFFTLMGQTVPAVSIYFCSLLIVKICVAVPMELCRPFPLSTILLMTTFMDKYKYTRRGLRTGAFYSWPMLYGWIYPQLVIVQMIMVVYAPLAPLLMPFCVIFYIFCYLMYKYQLLYVYVNTSQSGGFMWYAVFNRSLLGLIFSLIVLLSFFALDYNTNDAEGPFIVLFPLPFAVVYFWHHCDSIFKKKMDMSFRLAKQRDFRNNSKKESKQKIPLDSFKQHFYRQPVLTEPFQYPEEYRKTYDDDDDDGDDTYDTVVNPIQKFENDSSFIDPKTIELRKKLIDEQKERKRRLRMMPQILDVYRVEDEVEDSLETLENYFHDFVLQLRSSESKSTGSVSNETLDEKIRRRSISAYANEISNNHMSNEHSQNEDSDL